jgi:DHA2 family multidrug resistance protein-like MFS transporter
MAEPDTTTAASPRDGLPTRQRNAALVAILLSMALATLDSAITNTALPTIGADLGTDAETSIWVVSAYQIAMVAALLPLASLADILGHKRIYIAGLVVFTVASLACGLAWTLPLLAAARGIQGLGGAAIMSVNLALIRFIFPAAQLGRGAGINALVVALSFTVGPTVASAILSVASWHWLFLINVPTGALAFFLGQRNLPVTATNGARFDGPAAVLTALTFSLFIFGLNAFGHGSGWPLVSAELVGSLICAAALLRRQRGHPAPMLAVDLFKLPVFALSSLTSICSFTTQGLAFVSLPFLLQIGLGHSQVETGFLITPWPAMVAIMAPIAGRLSDRYPPGLLGGIGLAMLATGMAAMASLPAAPDVPDLVWRLMLCGAGFGFFQSPNLRALMSSAPPRRSGGASGIVATSRMVGQATGAALVALCFELSQTRAPVLALWIGCGSAAIGCGASFLRLVVAKKGPAA